MDVYAWLDTDEDIQSAYRSNVRRTAPESYRWLLEDAYDAYRALSFPVTLDGAPPAAEASLNGSTLTVTVRDNQFVSYASVLDGSGRRLTESAFFQEEPGTPCTLSVSFSGNALPETVYVQTEDYAANTIGYEVDVKALASGETAPPKRCAAMLLNDVPPSIGPTAAPPPSSLWRICPSTMFPAGPNTPRPCAGPMSRAWCPDGRTEPFTVPPMLPGRSWP